MLLIAQFRYVLTRETGVEFYPLKRGSGEYGAGFLIKTNRAKIKLSHLLLIFECNIFVFCTLLLGIAMVKYCAVAVCRNGTHNRLDLAYFAFPEDNTLQRKWIAFCKRADKKFKSLVDPRICSLHFKKTEVTVSVSGRKTVTGCPTIFAPTSTKTTTSARENRHEKRQTMHADQGPATKKRCVKKLNFRNDAEDCEKDPVDVGKVHHDHSYFRRQEQAIPEESTVSTGSSGGPPQDKPATHSTECQTDLTADEIEYLITELDECRKKAKILEEKLENKKRLKRELIIEDMPSDDESVKFYTGLPNLACFNFIWNLIQPYTEKIKYWDKKKRPNLTIRSMCQNESLAGTGN